MRPPSSASAGARGARGRRAAWPEPLTTRAGERGLRFAGRFFGFAALEVARRFAGTARPFDVAARFFGFATRRVGFAARRFAWLERIFDRAARFFITNPPLAMSGPASYPMNHRGPHSRMPRRCRNILRTFRRRDVDLGVLLRDDGWRLGAGAASARRGAGPGRYPCPATSTRVSARPTSSAAASRRERRPWTARAGMSG